MQMLYLNRFPFYFNLILFPNYRSLWDSLNNWTIFSLYLYWLQRRVAPVVVAGSGGGACDDRCSALAWCHVEVRRRLLGGCGERLLLLYGQQRRRQQPGGDDDDGLTQNSPNIIISTSSLLQLLQRWSLLRAWARERAPPSVLLTRRHRTGLSQQKISMGQAATVVAHPTATYPAGQLLYTEFEHIKYGCLNLLLRGLMTLTRRIFKNIFLFSKTFLYINITSKTK